jgi:virginiamycin B lyase
MWFSAAGGRCSAGLGNKIGRITPDGTISEFPVPTANSYPGALVAGPDGALWFGERFGNKIARMVAGGAITEYPVPTRTSINAGPCTVTSSSPAEGGIVVGPDGNLWFTEAAGNKIGRISPGGAIAEFPVPTPNSSPLGLAVGPDRALWFVERSASRVGRVTTAGAVTEFAMPTRDSFPNAIVAGPDGALWFSELKASRVGRITLDGRIVEYPAPGVGPVGLAVGPDGALWMVGYTSNEVVRMTTDGVVTNRYPIPTPKSTPIWLTLGPDGRLWFTETEVSRIGRMQVLQVSSLPRTGGAGPSTLPVLLAGASLVAMGLRLPRLGRADREAGRLSKHPSKFGMRKGEG